MSFFLIVIIIFLLLVIGWKYVSMQKLKRELNEMHDKLSNIIEQESANKVLMQTNRTSIQQMLIQVNRLLSHNQKVVADNVRTKASMKKMLSNMSHDLKTPLTVILVYIEKLNKDKTISEEERYEIMTRLHEKNTKCHRIDEQIFLTLLS